MRQRWKLDANGIAGLHLAAPLHDAHDAGTARTLAFGIARTPAERLQSVMRAIDLAAGCAFARDFHDAFIAETKQRARRQSMQVEAAREDVLSEVARTQYKALLREAFPLLLCKQMHLAKVGLRGIAAHAIEMLGRDAAMRISLDAKPREQADRALRLLGKSMLRCKRDSSDCRTARRTASGTLRNRRPRAHGSSLSVCCAGASMASVSP
jgi:hypothetical protein